MTTSWTKYYFRVRRFRAIALWLLIATTVQGEVAPVIGQWGHRASACTNFSNASTWRSDCIHLDGGQWTGIQRGCVDKVHPRPWPDEAQMEPLVSARNSGRDTSFNGWLAPGGSTFCLGFFDTGNYTTTLGVESSNFGLFTIGGNVGSYGARRSRDVECPQGSRSVGGQCVRRNAADPYKGFDQCPTNGTNPVNAFNGEKIHIENDYRGADAHPLRFTRYYGSDSAIRPGLWERSGFGRYWRHTYSRSIQAFDNGSQRLATVYLENGDRHYYREVDSGSDLVWEAVDPDVVGQLSLASNDDALTWTYINANGEAEKYDYAAGRLLSITNPQGFVTELTYNVEERLDAVTNAFGRGLQFDYHSSGIGNGLIASVTVTLDGAPIPDAQYRYTYEHSQRRGSAVTMIDKVYFPDDTPGDDSDNPFKDYLYNEPAHLYANAGDDIEAGPSTRSFHMPRGLTGIIDENGNRFATYKYKRFGFSGGNFRALAAGGGHGSPDENGKYADQYTILGFSSGALANDSRSHVGRTGIRDANGVRRYYHYALSHGVLRPTHITGDKCESCGTDVRSTTYDSATGFATGRTDFEGNITTLKHNDSGLEVCRIEGVSTLTPEKSAPRRVVTAWDTRFRVKTREQIFEPHGGADLSTCDENDNSGWAILKETKTDYELDSGRVAAITERHFPLDPSLPARRTSFTYYGSSDPNGIEFQLKSIDGPRTDVLDRTTYIYAVATADDHAAGDLVEVVNALGHTTVINSHDAHGRPIKTTDLNLMVSTRQYDPRGRLVENRLHNFDTDYEYDDVGNLLKITLPDNSFTKFFYDSAHRIVAIEDNLGNQIAYTLDPLGNRTKEDVRDPSQSLVRTLTRVYSDLGRLQKSIDGVGNETVFAYDENGQLDTTTDPSLNITNNNYDALNRVREVIDSLNNPTILQYDVLDNLTSVSDPRSNKTTYEYSAFGDLVELNSPDTGESTFAYDRAGNKIWSMDARGIEVAYEYDALNRLTFIDYPHDVDTQFIYDIGSAWTLTRRGRLAKMVDEAGTTEFRYEARGNLKEVDTTIDGVDYRVWYDYDAAGRLQSMIYPSGRRIDYSRDVLGNITGLRQTVSGETVELLSNGSYEPFGPINAMEFGLFPNPNNVGSATTIVNSEYDLAGRLVHRPSFRRTISANGTTSSLQFDRRRLNYDANSNVRVTRNGIPARDTSAYVYDELDRLVAWLPRRPRKSKRFEYDPNGNRTRLFTSGSGTIETNYEADSNRIVGTTSYDPNGNELGFGAREYGDSNRLRRALDDQGNELAAYVYNGMGRRVKKVEGVSTTIYHYDREGRLIAETGADGSAIAEYIYLNAEPFAIAIGGEGASAMQPGFVTDQTGRGQVWRRWNNPEASAGQVLLSPQENSANLDTGSQAVYPMVVSKRGAYTLYVRGQGADWAGDSAHVTNSLSGRTEFVNFTNDAWAFEWNALKNRVSVARRDVGRTFEITLTRRQRDTEIDVFVLSLNPNLSARELDELTGLGGTRTTLADTYVWEAEGSEPWSADGGEIYFYHNDHLGTPQYLSDPSGREVWRASYDPFGKATVSKETIINNLRFPGQYYDAETGLHYNLFRDYDPESGRYVQSDPIALNGGLNTFAYGSNNPINRIDPSGLVDWQGTFVLYGASLHAGVIFGEFNLTTCVDGKQVTVTLGAKGAGGDFGLPLTSFGGEIEFSDGESTPNPFVFNGVFSAVGGGISLGAGINIGKIRLGDASSKGWLIPVAGLDVSLISGYTGTSWLIGHSETSCCK